MAFLSSFLRSRSGSISILAAALMVVAIGFTGLAVDLGAIFYWQNRLQAATDAAAMAATFDPIRPADIAGQALKANGLSSAIVESAEAGAYLEDPAVDQASRFVSGAGQSAVRLKTRYDVPIHFMRLFGSGATAGVSAEALAYMLPLAGIAIGTDTAQSDISLLNSVIAAETGNAFNLTEAERDALDATRISALRIIDRLAQRTGSQTQSIETVNAASVTLNDIADAASQALSAQAANPDGTQAVALATLERIAQNAAGTATVTLSDILQFAAHRKRTAKDLVSNANDALAVPALSLIMGYVQMSRQNALVDEDVTIALGGLATVSVKAVLSKSALGGNARAISAIGPAGTAAYSSQARIALDIALLQPIAIDLGLIKLSLPMTIPVLIDIGYGSASISAISCGPDVPSSADIAVAAQSGAAHLYIGTVPLNQLMDLTVPLAPSPATLVSLPLVQIGGGTDATIAQSDVETLHFSWSDIANNNVQSIYGLSSLSSALTQAGNDLVLTVNKAPLGAGGLIAGLVRPQISAVLAALAPVLEPILADLGLRLGAIDVRATGLRCGIPALVD